MLKTPGLEKEYLEGREDDAGRYVIIKAEIREGD